MHQSPWVLQALIHDHQRGVIRAMARPRSDPPCPVRRLLRVRWVLAEVRVRALSKAPGAESPSHARRQPPPAGRVIGMLDRAG